MEAYFVGYIGQEEDAHWQECTDVTQPQCTGVARMIARILMVRFELYASLARSKACVERARMSVVHKNSSLEIRPQRRYVAVTSMVGCCRLRRSQSKWNMQHPKAKGDAESSHIREMQILKQ